MQEEADERIMLHVNHAYLTGVKTVMVVSHDTDVFVMLLSHLERNWNNSMEIFLKMGARRLSKIFPLHHVRGYVEGEILAKLPGIHA